MARNIIPVRTDIYSYSMVISLDDVDYTLSFVYNFRSLKWFMSIEDYVYGIKLTHSYDFLNQFKYLTGFPQGIFSVIDKTGNEAEPNIDNFGDTVVLVYEEV